MATQKDVLISNNMRILIILNMDVFFVVISATDGMNGKEHWAMGHLQLLLLVNVPLIKLRNLHDCWLVRVS